MAAASVIVVRYRQNIRTVVLFSAVGHGSRQLAVGRCWYTDVVELLSAWDYYRFRRRVEGILVM